MPKFFRSDKYSPSSDNLRKENQVNFDVNPDYRKWHREVFWPGSLKGKGTKIWTRLISKFLTKLDERKKPHLKIFFFLATVSGQSFWQSQWWRHYGQEAILPICLPYKWPTLKHCILLNFAPFLIGFEAKWQLIFWQLVSGKLKYIR